MNLNTILNTFYEAHVTKDGVEYDMSLSPALVQLDGKPYITPNGPAKWAEETKGSLAFVAAFNRLKADCHEIPIPIVSYMMFSNKHSLTDARLREWYLAYDLEGPKFKVQNELNQVVEVYIWEDYPDG